MKQKYTFPITKEMVTARCTKRISTKTSVTICKKISNTDFLKTKNFVSGMVDKKKDINGKYYTKTAEGILEVLKLIENNAISRGFDPEQMRLFISAHQGPRMFRGRRKRKFGVKLKVSHIHAVLKKKTERKKKGAHRKTEEGSSKKTMKVAKETKG